MWKAGCCLLCLGVLGCGNDSQSAPAHQAVDILLNQVVVRQYRGEKRLAAVRAARVRLNERDEILRADGDVRATFHSEAWEKK